MEKYDIVIIEDNGRVRIIGKATSIEDAKQQGFKNPILHDHVTENRRDRELEDGLYEQ